MEEDSLRDEEVVPETGRSVKGTVHEIFTISPRYLGRDTYNVGFI